MFLADLLNFKNVKRVKLALNEETQANSTLHHRGHLSTLPIWTLDMERED